MLSLFGLLALLVLIVMGWGLILDALLQRIVGRMAYARCGVAEAGLIGLSVLAGAVSVIHWLTPINFLVSSLLAIVGLAGLLMRVRCLLESDDPPLPVTLAVLVASAAIGLIMQSSAVTSYDSGLYHLPFLKWIGEEPVALGLGNLEGRLGFNSMWLSLSAAFVLPETGLRGPFMADAVLFIFFVTILVKHLITSRIVNFPWSTAFAAGLLACILVTMPTFYFGLVLSTDNSATLFTLMAFFLALRLADQLRQKNELDRITWGRDTFLLFTVTIMACTVKLSSAPVVLLLLAPLAAHRIGGASVRPLVVGLFAFAGLGLVWVTRNVALTGCLAYPVAPTCFDALPWSVGYDQAAREAEAITGWARQPGPGSKSALGNWEWLRSWYWRIYKRPVIKDLELILVVAIPICTAGWITARLRPYCVYAITRNRMLTSTLDVIVSIAVISWVFWFFLDFSILIILAMGLAPIAVAAECVLRLLNSRLGQTTTRRDAVAGFTGILAVTTAVIGCVFWFLFAPDPRFSNGFMLAMVLVPTAVAAEPLIRLLSSPRLEQSIARRAVVYGLAGILAVTIAEAQLPSRALRLAHLGTWPKVKEALLLPRWTSQGILVWTPTESDQCWDSPLPCTPYFNADLRFYRFQHLPYIVDGSRQSPVILSLPPHSSYIRRNEELSGETGGVAT